MEIKECKRCGKTWCFRGEGRPVRCGKCKSPYWDQEREKENGTSENDLRVLSGGVRRSAENIERVEGRISAGINGGDTAISFGELEICGYREWSGELGEYIECSLAKHDFRSRHGNWKKVAGVQE